MIICFSSPWDDNKTENVYMNWALAFMSIDRIPVTHLNMNDRIPAADIPFENLIPGTANFQTLHDRMKVITGRILTEYLPWFKQHMSDFVIVNMPHEHSAALSQKNVMVKLYSIYLRYMI